MAYQVSIAENIAKVAGAGFELTQQLYKIADRVGASGSEVRSYAKEINAFSKVLLLIKTQTSLSHSISALKLNLVKEITDLCHKILAPLTQVQQTLNRFIKLYGRERKNIEQISQRIQWYFSERQKLLFFREALRSQQQNLNMLLAAMSYDASRDLIDEMALENTMREGSHPANESTPKVSFLRDSPSPFRPTTFESHENGYDSEDSCSSPTTWVDLEKDYKAGLPFLTEQELQELDDKIANDLDPNGEGAGLMLWKETRVFARRTKHFAESVLKSNAVCTLPHTSTKPFSSSLPHAEVQSDLRSETVWSDKPRSLPSIPKSSFSNHSTSWGLWCNKVESPVQKDERENVIQMVEKPLTSPQARKRPSIFSFGTVKSMVTLKYEMEDLVRVAEIPSNSAMAKRKKISTFGKLKQTLSGPPMK